MDPGRPSLSSRGDSLDSDDLVPPGTTGKEHDTSSIAVPRKVKMSKKGIENAKKRLRAFSIQKKTPITPISVPKPVNSGSTTVLIGKLASVRTTPKPEVEPDQKKLPKPPKPGTNSYTQLQKRTLSEIEDMKRKMELVELGIPLGLICPSPTSEKAMPTKAMPPIKTFLDESKVDELIREAKKAKAAGREFKFDYQKLLPDYDNPFQRKKDELGLTDKEKAEDGPSTGKIKPDRDKKELESGYKSRKIDKYSRRYDHKKDDRDKRDKYKDKRKDRDNKEKEDKGKSETKKVPKETDVNLNDYFVCDTWSLDTDDKTSFSSPKVDSAMYSQWKARQAADLIKETLLKKDALPESPRGKPVKIEKLKPVIDSFKFEIDPNEEEVLDMFDENSALEKFDKPTTVKDDPFDSPVDLKLFDYDQDLSKEGVIDANDDTFLESVINEIKQENMSDDTSQDKGLVEYDMSPKDDYDDNSKNDASLGSVTPELDDRMRDLQSSQHSHYSDGYRSTESYKSTESGYKSTESGYKSTETSYKSTESSYKSTESNYKSTETNYKSAETIFTNVPSFSPNEISYKNKDRSRPSTRQADNYRLSVEKDLDEALEGNMSKSTVESLETWSFVLKICQPLLFRHDRNKCYKETHVHPKIWFAENPKGCSCVKDRSVVYEELEMCKMGLVDRVYGCDQIADEPPPTARSWYPRVACDAVSGLQLSTDWETEEDRPQGSLTPQHTEEIYLDREYQRFMEAVWPDVAEPAAETSRSTTPVRQDNRKKKKQPEEPEKEEEKKKAKKIKLSSEGWSQESDVEEDNEKHGKKLKQEKAKARKRKHSVSSSDSTTSESEDDKKKKFKKKGGKKLKAKLAKKRRIDKKLKKRLKEKQKKKKKLPKVEELSDDSEDEKDKKKEKKIKKKKFKLNKIQKKKKVKAKSSSSSSSSTSSSDTESDVEKKKKIKKKVLAAKKKKKDKKKKRKQSSDSTQSEELFDVNVLKNIKTERMSDDEFSPRRQKPREIINVKELQNDFVGNNIHIKQEKVESPKEVAMSPPIEQKKEEICDTVQSPIEPVAETKTEEIEPVKVPTPEPVQEIESPKMPEESYSIPLPDELVTPTNLDEIALPCDESPSTEKKEVTEDKEASSQSHSEASANQGDDYQKQGEIYQKQGDTYQKQSDIYKKQGDIYHKQCDTYQKQDDTYPKQGEIYEKQGDNSQNQGDPYQKQSELYEKQDDTYQKQDILYQKPVETYQKQDDLYQNQGSVYQKQDDTKQDDIYRKQGSVYHKQGNTYQKQSDIYQKQGDIYHRQVDTYEKQDDPYQKQGDIYQKDSEGEGEEKFADSYEMLEQMAMAYQSDVANQHLSGTVPPEPLLDSPQSQRIETLVRRRGEIKCDWRAGDSPTPQQHQRPSRWGLKPGEVNIVLTGGRAPSPPARFPIRVLERGAAPSGYDEAYMDMFGSLDRMQYGDCFAPEPQPSPAETRLSSLDERINRALRQTTLGEVTKETDDVETDTPDKGILVMKSLYVEPGRGAKRVSFADGYKPGQDSDTEEPPIKKRKKSRRVGCAWPCPATHADHVPLWDALPPPPPPAGSPPPPAARAPPLHLLRRAPPRAAPMHQLKRDPNVPMPPFMPPEPPPGFINFQ